MEQNMEQNMEQFTFDDLFDKLEESIVPPEPEEDQDEDQEDEMREMLREAITPSSGPLSSVEPTFASPRHVTHYADDHAGLVNGVELLHLLAGKKLSESVVFENYNRTMQEFAFLMSDTSREMPAGLGGKRAAAVMSFRPGVYRIVGTMHCGSDAGYFLVPIKEELSETNGIAMPFAFARHLWVDKSQVEQYLASRRTPVTA